MNTLACGCPGANVRSIDRNETAETVNTENRPSELRPWPTQLHLVPPHAPYLQKTLDGEPGQSAIIAENAKCYAALLRGHIEKEDDILYPLAERVLPEEVRERMLGAYDGAEQETPGLEDKYRKLVEHYELQAAAAA